MVALSRLAQIRAAANLSIVIIIMIIILFLFLFCQIMYTSKSNYNYFGLCRLSFQIFCYFEDDDFTLIAVLKVINIISKRSLWFNKFKVTIF